MGRMIEEQKLKGVSQVCRGGGTHQGYTWAGKKTVIGKDTECPCLFSPGLLEDQRTNSCT